MSHRRWCFTKTEVENSPSRRHGISPAKEIQLRSDYCSHIESTCEALKLSRYTKAAATILCHRFFARRSHAKCCHHTIASACVFLAAKAHDAPRSLKHIVDVVYRREICDKVKETMTRYNNTHFSVDKATRVRYAEERERTLRSEKAGLVLKAERVVLHTLGFDVDVELPYKGVVTAWERLRGCEISRVDFDRLGGVAWGLVGEWVKTAVCLRFGAKSVGLGSVVVAARVLGVKLPKEEEWVCDELGVTLEELKEVVCCMESKIVRNENAKESNDDQTVKVVSAGRQLVKGFFKD